MAQSYRSNSKKRKCKRISLELVSEAIAALQETGGSTQNEVCKYLSSKYNLPSTYRAGIAKALRRGIRNSALTYLPRKYRIARRPKSRRGRRRRRRPSRRRKGRSLTRRRRQRRGRSRRRVSQGRRRRRARSRRRRSSRRWGSSKRRRSSRRQRRRRRTTRRRRTSRRFNSSSRRRRRRTRRYRRRSVGTNVTEEDIRRCPQHLNDEKDVNHCDLCRRQQGLEERGVNKKADIPREPLITACEITGNDEGDTKLGVAEAGIKAGYADERKLIGVDEDDGERQEEADEEEMDEGENQEETDEEEMDDDDPEWLPENILDIDLEDSEEEVGETEEEMEDDGQFFLPDYLSDVDLEEIERQLEESEGQIDDEDDDEPLSENQLDYDPEYTEGELSEAEEGMEEEDPEWLLNDENESGGEMEPLIGGGSLKEDQSFDNRGSGQRQVEGETAVLQEGIEGDDAMEPGLTGLTRGNDEHRGNEDKIRAEIEDSIEEDSGQGGQLADPQGREGENESEIPIESELGAGDGHLAEEGQSEGFSCHDRLEGDREEEVLDGTAAEQVDHVQTEHGHRDVEDNDNQPESLQIEGRMRQGSEQEEGHSEYFSTIEQPMGESSVPALRDMGASEQDNQGYGQLESLCNGEPERFETEATNEGTEDINDGEGQAAEHVQQETLQMENYIDQGDGQDEEQSEYYSIVEEPVEERDVPAINDLDVDGEENQQSRRQVAFPEPEWIERGAEEIDEVMVEGDERANEAVEFEDVEDPWIELDREEPGNFEEESGGGDVRNEQDVNDVIDVR